MAPARSRALRAAYPSFRGRSRLAAVDCGWSGWEGHSPRRASSHGRLDPTGPPTTGPSSGRHRPETAGLFHSSESWIMSASDTALAVHGEARLHDPLFTDRPPISFRLAC